MTVDTTKAPRRELHFASLDEALADAEQLAAGPVETTGNRTAPDLIKHLAESLEMQIKGLDPKSVPVLMRFLIGPLFGGMMRKKFLRDGMSPGFKLPDSMAAKFYPPAPEEMSAAIEAYRVAIDKLRAADSIPRNPVFGRFTLETAEAFHCRHADLHLSFIRPAAAD